MAPQLLASKEEINTRMAELDPVTRQACLLFAERLIDEPDLLNSGRAACEAADQCCCMALYLADFDPREYPSIADQFVQDHMADTMQIGFSIIHVLQKQQKQKAVMGFLGKAAAVAAGVALGVWVG